MTRGDGSCRSLFFLRFLLGTTQSHHSVHATSLRLFLLLVTLANALTELSALVCTYLDKTSLKT